MKKILLLGAGRSSGVLINFLLNHVSDWDAKLTVGDQSFPHAEAKVNHHENGTPIMFDATDEVLRKNILREHDFVISLLPPHLHILVAKECVMQKKNLITASYVTPEMQQLNEDVKRAGLLFMCEMGLDPGIDHMSAMQMIHSVQQMGGTITSYKSGTGGLVAPDCDDNPWHYKVTWNPRNIVLAGQGVTHFLENGIQKFIPYQRLFSETDKFKIPGFGKFEAYANRDSMQYISKYGLDGVKTIMRSTLRREGFCEAWNAIIHLGLTDDSYTMQCDGMTYAQWLMGFLPEKKKSNEKSVKERVAKLLDLDESGDVIKRLKWLGLFSDEKIQVAASTPAQILQRLIESKWVMQPADNDMIVMRHELEYFMPDEKKFRRTASMVLTGDNAEHTAMAKTVGLPMGLMAKLMLTQDLFLTGVHIPVMAQVYEPVMQELETFGVVFSEEEEEI